MKHLSPERSEFIEILFLTVFRKVKLFYCAFGFLTYILLLFSGIPQVRFFYLTLFPVISPWLLEQVFKVLHSKRKKATAPVYFPMLQKKLRFSHTAFVAHAISMLLYYVLMPYLVFTMPYLITWCFLATCIILTILFLILSIRKINRLVLFHP